MPDPIQLPHLQKDKACTSLSSCGLRDVMMVGLEIRLKGEKTCIRLPTSPSRSQAALYREDAHLPSVRLRGTKRVWLLKSQECWVSPKASENRVLGQTSAASTPARRKPGNSVSQTPSPLLSNLLPLFW